jgi:phosphoglycerate dehydrogenase-like enzyme
MPKIVLVPPSADAGAIARDMAPKRFELALLSHTSPEFEAALAGMDYMVCYPNVQMPDAFYGAAPRLKLVQLLSAGYDNVDLPAARRAKVPICNNGGANAISVAEHSLMLMLAVARKVIWQHGNVAAGRWRGNEPAPRLYELHGKTLGIVGLGTIGKKTARLAQAFGMRVQYYDIRRLSEDAEDGLVVRFRLLRELLETSDVVSLHVPLNASTRGMIAAEELALMKPLAILVNTARGPVIDETALYHALSAGRLFGAGLDVFDQEPPASGNPLFALDNVVLTAHFAGPTWDNHVARFRNAFDNVERVERGEPPLWLLPELAG